VTRSVLFDTETTGLDPASGHRVVEIAAIELINGLPTKTFYHTLVDPERDMPEDAMRIHGISAARLRGQPRFADVAPALLEFLGDGELVAHNAPFDFGFLDSEFVRLGLPRLDPARMVDTLALAKERFPGLPNSLDALCRRFEIDLSARTTHNALLDCRLLADVYVELTGGRQRGLSLVAEDGGTDATVYVLRGTRSPRPIVPAAAELAAHAAFVARLRDPLWPTC
jgi:DNA polymerase-3 subunit epsilon